MCIILSKDRCKKLKTGIRCHKKIQSKWLNPKSNSTINYEFRFFLVFILNYLWLSLCAVIIHEGQSQGSGYFYSVIQCPFSLRWFKYKDKVTYALYIVYYFLQQYSVCMNVTVIIIQLSYKFFPDCMQNNCAH